MNRLQSAALEVSILTFSRDRRHRDGDVIRDLALDMIEDGKTVRQQTTSLVLAGFSDRFNALGSNPTNAFVRRGLCLLAALLAPVLFATVAATFAVTAFFDVQSPNNELATGFSISKYWFIHAGLPWGLSLIGALLACVGFARCNRSIARVGSIAILLGAWLVVGTMGGWFAGEGFVGPAEIPLGTDGFDFGGSLYVIAPISAISLLLTIAAIVMPRDEELPTLAISPLTAVLPGAFAIPLVGFLSLLDYKVAGVVFAAMSGALIALPVLALRLRNRESTRAYAAFASGVAVVFLTIPSLLLFDQLLTSIRLFDLVIAPQVFLGLIAVAMLGGTAVTVRSLLTGRQHA